MQLQLTPAKHLPKFQKQYPDEGDNGTLFASVEEYLQELFFSVLSLKIWEEILAKMAMLLVRTFQKRESC